MGSVAIILFLLLLSSLISVGVYGVGGTFRDCEMCPEMVVLPAGEFTMGSAKEERGGHSDERPQRQVIISKPFAVSKYEITVGQFAEFVRKTKHDHESCGEVNNHPVACISWDDASAYIDWLSTTTRHEYRLLTEAEWEYAARAGTTTAYHTGEVILVNQAQYSVSGATAVGGFPANAFGLYDMHGNVWEWVEDCWHDDYTNAPTDGSAWLSGCKNVNLRILRGGSWDSVRGGLRSAFRSTDYASDGDYNFGFRIARDLSP